MTFENDYNYDTTSANKLLVAAMDKRGWLRLSSSVAKLDLHLYYEDIPLIVNKNRVTGTPELKVRVKMYSRNQEMFISYCFTAIYFSKKKGFREKHNFAHEYSLVLKVIRRLLDESHVYNLIMNDIVENSKTVR